MAQTKPVRFIPPSRGRTRSEADDESARSERRSQGQERAGKYPKQGDDEPAGSQSTERQGALASRFASSGACVSLSVAELQVTDLSERIQTCGRNWILRLEPQTVSPVRAILTRIGASCFSLEGIAEELGVAEKELEPRRTIAPIDCTIYEFTKD